VCVRTHLHYTHVLSLQLCYGHRRAGLPS
jgi:hypothetical protein